LKALNKGLKKSNIKKAGNAGFFNVSEITGLNI